MNSDEATRVRQGACETTSPEILLALASDPSVTVRASLALNPALPDKVCAILKEDVDVRVRVILSRKLASLAPTLADDARQQVQRDAVASLTAMVADAGLRVRASIADAVRDMPDGPREIVLRLAHDPAVMVCEPVILFSPMLTQEDLVALVVSGAPPSSLLAVANRRRIGPEVSDAIVGSADAATICALLRNPTAQIREATLDALAAQSEEHVDWQEPLVRRPHLPSRAQKVLLEIVSGHLLHVLAARDDLDPKLKLALRAALQRDASERRTLEHSKPSDAPGQSQVDWAPPRPVETAQDRALTGGASSGWSVRIAGNDGTVAAAAERARALHQAGKLDDGAILDAMRSNASAAAKAMLAVKADVDINVIDRACALRSAKAIVSLAWKAGFSMQTAVALQTVLARMPPDQTLLPGPENSFPLTEDEMHWQLAFLGAGDTESRAWTPRRL